MDAQGYCDITQFIDLGSISDELDNFEVYHEDVLDYFENTNVIQCQNKKCKNKKSLACYIISIKSCSRNVVCFLQ